MSSSQAKTAPYGSWKSPITSDLIVAQSIALSDVRIDGGNIYWLEGRPQEQGRSWWCGPQRAQRRPTSRRRHSTSAPACTNTAAARGPCADGAIYFSNFSDGRLYRQAPGASVPEPLTPEPPARAGSGVSPTG